MALYKKLRTEMYTEDATQADLARILGKSDSYVTCRMAGHYAFSIEDAYKILDHFNLPHDQLHEFFPPGGKARKKVLSA